MAVGWRGQYQRYKDFYLNILALYKQRADLRAFLEIILSIATVVIFLVFALKPTALTIINLYGQIQEKKTTVASLDKKISDLQTANRIFSQSQSYIPDVDASVGNRPQPDLISQQIQLAAEKDSVNVLGISIGQVTLIGTPSKKTAKNLSPLPDNSNEMPISVSVGGDYSSLMVFLNDLENLRMVSKIDTVSLTTSSTNKTNVVMIIAARVPYLNQ